MRKIFTGILLLFCFALLAQTPGGPKVDAVRYTNKVTDAIMFGWTPPADERPQVWNETQGKGFQWNGSSWIEIGAGGGGSGGIALADQTVTRGTAIYNTGAATDVISYRQESTELMRLGGNNDNAMYVKGIEAIPGDNFTSLYSPLQLSIGDPTSLPAASYTGALIRQNVSPFHVYYSDGTNWLNLNDAVNKIQNTVTGRTGTAINSAMIQTEAQLTTDGTPPADSFILCSDCAPAESLTGTALSLDQIETQYNMSAASAAATFTTTNVKSGGYAVSLINKAAPAPTVTGATQLPNTAAFIASTNMLLCVKAFGSTVKYWFVEY